MKPTLWKSHGRTEIAAEPTLPGVWRTRTGSWFVRGRAVDPKTGKLREVSRVLEVDTAADALTWLQAQLKQVRAGMAEQPQTSRQRFADFAVSLLERKIARNDIWSAKGKEKWDVSLTHHLIPAFGPYWIDAITRADVEAWKDRIAERIAREELAPTTANTHFSILRVILAAAQGKAHAASEVEPFDLSGWHPYTEEEPNALAPDQVPKFLGLMRVAFPQHFAMTALGFATGLRPSSMRPLRRTGPTPDVLWNDGVLYVRRSCTRGEVADRTKTGLRQKLHLPKELIDILRWHEDHLSEIQSASDLLFPSDVGGLRADSVLDKPFKAVSESLDLPYKLTPRGMRRTYQDLMRVAKVENVVARSVSGHLTESMQELYSTVAPTEQRVAIAKVIELAKFKEALG